MIYSFCFEIIKCCLVIIIIHYLFMYIKGFLKEILYVNENDFKIDIKTKPHIPVVPTYPQGTTPLFEVQNDTFLNVIEEEETIVENNNLNTTPTTLKKELFDYINNEFLNE